MTVAEYCRECRTIHENNPRLVAMCPTCNLPTETMPLLKLWRMDANDIGKPVLVKALVAGESAQKAVYLEYTARCIGCEKTEKVDLSIDDYAILQLATRSSQPKALARLHLPRVEKGKAEEKHTHTWVLEPCGKAYDYRIIKVRDLVEIEETAEKVSSARDYTVILFLKLPAEKRLVLNGSVLIDPRTNDLMLLVRDCGPLASIVDGFKLTDREMLELKVLQGKALAELRELLDKTVAPEIVGRELAKLADTLGVVSVNWLPPLAKGQAPLPGCMRVWFIGDPRTGKGSIERWFKEVAGIGEHGFGEAASRAGLLYWVDSESGVIVWGLLVQADLGLAIIEGMHGLPREQIPEFREAIAQQFIEVRKRVSGTAWARSRILADANSTTPMKELVWPCQAFSYVPCFRDPADLTRIDLPIPFDEDDVPLQEIAKTAQYAERKGLDPRLFAKLALWGWSRKVSQIEVTSEAMEKAKEVFAELQAYKSARIPLIHPGSLTPILRISTAFAVLTFSTPDGERVRVEKEHVAMTRELLLEILDMWRVRDFIEATGKIELSDEECEEMRKIIVQREVYRNALFELSLKPYLAKDLAQKIDADYGYLRNVFSDLRARDLVVNKSDGYHLTSRGAFVVKTLILGMDDRKSFEILKEWVLNHRDNDGLLDMGQLAEHIKAVGLDKEKALKRLRSENVLTDSPQLGKMLVLAK